MISIRDTIIPAGHTTTGALPANDDPTVTHSPKSPSCDGFRAARDKYRVGPRPRLQGASLGGN